MCCHSVWRMVVLGPTTRRVVAAKMTKNDQPNWAHRNPKLDPTASIWGLKGPARTPRSKCVALLECDFLRWNLQGLGFRPWGHGWSWDVMQQQRCWTLALCLSVSLSLGFLGFLAFLDHIKSELDYKIWPVYVSHLISYGLIMINMDVYHCLPICLPSLCLEALSQPWFSYGSNRQEGNRLAETFRELLAIYLEGQ
jgi:hypothetical protein